MDADNSSLVNDTGLAKELRYRYNIDTFPQKEGPYRTIIKEVSVTCYQVSGLAAHSRLYQPVIVWIPTESHVILERDMFRPDGHEMC